MARVAHEIEREVGRRIAPRTQCSLMVEVRIGARPWTPALLADLSATGFRLRGVRDIGECRSLWVRPRGMEPLPAKVRWAAGADAGCEFLYPLDRHAERALHERVAEDAPRELTRILA